MNNERERWIEEQIATMLAHDLIGPSGSDRNAIVAYLHNTLAFADASRPQYPNNVVACVQCKKPVTVNALNAIHCEACTADPYPHAAPTRAGGEIRNEIEYALVIARQGSIEGTTNREMFEYIKQRLERAFYATTSPPPAGGEPV